MYIPPIHVILLCLLLLLPPFGFASFEILHFEANIQTWGLQTGDYLNYSTNIHFRLNNDENLIDKSALFCKSYCYHYNERNSIISYALGLLIAQFDFFWPSTKLTYYYQSKPYQFDTILPNADIDAVLYPFYKSCNNVVASENICSEYIVLDIYNFIWKQVSDYVNNVIFKNGFTLELAATDFLLGFSPEDLKSESYFLESIDEICASNFSSQFGRSGEVLLCRQTVYDLARTKRQCILHSTLAPYNEKTFRLATFKWNADFRFVDAFQFPKKSPLLYIGGNQGHDLREFLKILDKETSYYVFEPLLEYYELLKSEFVSNKNVHIYQQGIGEKNGVACFHVSGFEAVGTSQIKGSFVSADNLDNNSVLDYTNDNSNCSDIRSASQLILEEIKSPNDQFNIHMNCEGCEFETINSWIDSGAISKIAVLQFQSHKVDWVGDSVSKYCSLRLRLSETHDVVWEQPWCWERWILKSQRWQHVSFDDTTTSSPNSDILIETSKLASSSFVSNISDVVTSVEKKDQTAIYTVYCHSSYPSNRFRITNAVKLPIEGLPSFFLSDNFEYGQLAEKLGWKFVPIFPLVTDEMLTEEADANMKCKLPRTQPHHFHPLDQFGITVYVDLGVLLDSIRQVNFSISRFVDVLKQDTTIAFISRASCAPNSSVCSTDYFNSAMMQDRYAKDAKKYKQYCIDKHDEGFLGNKVLYGGFQIRNMLHPMTRIIGSFWYSEIQRSGIEDQFSLAFVYEKYKHYFRLLCSDFLFKHSYY